MKRNKSELFEIWVNLLLGLLAIVAVKSIFENDHSKIVSKKGIRILSDESRMRDINEKIHESEKNNEHNDIII